ncbi:hypothetical protein C2S51_006641 [Perilla frutescens var. frutescens]|nr:hypothetical protein C2S51_006641 [Perilla frutescens var. frutescens]
MNNSSASESMEIASQVSTTQNTSGIATIERNYDQTVQDIENQNMQAVSVEVEPLIVIGTSFNQQQHPVQDIENPNLEEFDGAPPNFVDQQHTVEDNEPNQNWEEVSVEVDPPIAIGTSFKQQHDSVEDIENPNLEEAPPIFVQQQHTVQDNDGNQNWEGVAPASPSLILQLPDTIQDDGSQTSEGVASASPSVSLQLPIQDNGSQTSEGTGRPSDPDVESMYRAAFEGDWDKAEKLLNKDKTLAYRERHSNLPKKNPIYQNSDSNLSKEETEIKWYRPLHVAVASKHNKFALKLIKWMDPDDLELNDSNGLTACCYAAASGSLDIAREMIKKQPKLVEDPSNLASAIILRGKSEVISYFLRQTAMKCLSKESWLGLLQNAIDSKMNDVALKILEKDYSLATMKNDKGTALHVLARQDISTATTGKLAMIFKSIFGTTLKGLQGHGKMPPDFYSLAARLLAKIQEMDEPNALELLNDPPILHDAAKVGNVDLIRMITHAYPDLIWQTDERNHSLFSTAIEYREANVFSFVQRFVALDLSCFFEEDEDENNLLHLAAKSGSRKNEIPVLQMQSEIAWYKAVEAMVPVEYIKEKNKDKKTPRDLFVATHEQLLEESKAWMKSTADSCMLIATIILTVVYAAAFTVPEGNSEETGLPILVKSNWLTCFFIFEALALFSSTLCIITFWSITCSGFVEDQFLYVLPYQLRLGFTALFGSLVGAISAFLSAYHMVLVEGKAWLVKSFLLSIYAILVLAICGRFSELWYKTKLPECLPQMMSKRNGQGPYGKRGKTDHTVDKSQPDAAKAK